jgi:hypothetical protein
VRRDQPGRFAGLGADGAEHVQVVVLRLADRRRPRADPGPDARQRAVLPETRLVLIVGQDAFVRVRGPDLVQALRQFFFLKASSAAGSVSGWRGRGIRSLYPRRCSSL